MTTITFFTWKEVSNIKLRRLLLSTKLVVWMMPEIIWGFLHIHKCLKLICSMPREGVWWQLLVPAAFKVTKLFRKLILLPERFFRTFTQLHYFPSPRGYVFPYYIQLHRHILYYPTYCIVKYLTSQHGDGILPGPVFMLPGNQVYSKLVCMKNFILMP